MGKIIISGLKLYAYHGVNQHEKDDGQIFIVDLCASLNLDKPCVSDNVEHTVSYAAMVKSIRRIMTASNDNLIERAAYRIAEGLLFEFSSLETVCVTLKKPDAPISAEFDYVAVELTLSRDELFAEDEPDSDSVGNEQDFGINEELRSEPMPKQEDVFSFSGFKPSVAPVEQKSAVSPPVTGVQETVKTSTSDYASWGTTDLPLSESLSQRDNETEASAPSLDSDEITVPFSAEPKGKEVPSYIAEISSDFGTPPAESFGNDSFQTMTEEHTALVGQETGDSIGDLPARSSGAQPTDEASDADGALWWASKYEQPKQQDEKFILPDDSGAQTSRYSAATQADSRTVRPTAEKSGFPRPSQSATAESHARDAVEDHRRFSLFGKHASTRVEHPAEKESIPVYKTGIDFLPFEEE